MTTTKRRSERQQWNPDLGVLAARLSDATQAELFERLGEQGHPDLHPRHGVVLAYLDEDGIRPTELARLSGRHKQIVGRLVDELEQLGYTERRPDPADRAETNRIIMDELVYGRFEPGSVSALRQIIGRLKAAPPHGDSNGN